MFITYLLIDISLWIPEILFNLILISTITKGHFTEIVFPVLLHTHMYSLIGDLTINLVEKS